MGDRPTHRVSISAKGDDRNRPRNYDAGVAFPNKVGGLNLRLNPGVVLTHETTQEFYVNLNPIDEEREAGQRRKRLGNLHRPRDGSRDGDVPDDDGTSWG